MGRRTSPIAQARLADAAAVTKLLAFMLRQRGRGVRRRRIGASTWRTSSGGARLELTALRATRAVAPPGAAGETGRRMIVDAVFNGGSNFCGSSGNSSGIDVLEARTAAVRSRSELGSVGADRATTPMRSPQPRQGGGLV